MAPFSRTEGNGVFGPRDPLFQQMGIRAPVWGRWNEGGDGGLGCPKLYHGSECIPMIRVKPRSEPQLGVISKTVFLIKLCFVPCQSLLSSFDPLLKPFSLALARQLLRAFQQTRVYPHRFRTRRLRTPTCAWMLRRDGVSESHLPIAEGVL